MSQSLVAVVACLGGATIALVDGPASVRLAALVAGLTLAPAASTVGGAPAAGLLAGAGLCAGLLGLGAERLALRRHSAPGLDPLVPVVASRDKLFGPRSGRAFGAAVALLAASWLGLNVEVGVAATASGSVFAAADIWLVGVVRLLRARAVEDLAVGAVAVSLATGCGWVLEVGPSALAEAAAVCALATASAVSAGWLVGRHHRRPGEVTA